MARHFTQTRLANASVLAVAGRYVEAEALIKPQGLDPTDDRELDLLARIQANQAKYLKAHYYWVTASKAALSEVEYSKLANLAMRAEWTRREIRQLCLVVSIISIAAITIVSLVGR